MSDQASTETVAPSARTAGRGRCVGVYLLLGTAGVLLLLTSFAVWVNRVALNTNQFVDTSSQLIDDDAIRQAIGTRAVDELYANVDVQAELKKQLPKDLKPASGALAAGGREAAYFVVDRALEQPALQNVWRATVRQSHQQLVDVLEGGGTTVSTEEGVVTLDLRPIVLDAADRIGIRQTVEDKLPTDVGQVEVLRSDQLNAAQAGFEILKALAWFLPVLTLGVFALAVWLASGRRRLALRDVGIVISLTGIVGLVAVNMTGGYVVDALATDTETRTASRDAWDITTELLRSSFRWQIVVGLLFVLAAWLAGPRRYAVASRQLIAPLLRERVYPYVAVAVIGFVVLVTGPATDFARLLFVVVLVALLVAGVEIMRRQTLREFPDGAGASSLGEARTRITEWLEARRREQPASSSGTGTDATLSTQLTQLAELHASGALTDAEYRAAKARVLDGDE